MKKPVRFFKILPLGFAILSFSAAQAGDQNTGEYADSAKLIGKATVRFQAKLTSKEYESFKESAADFTTGPKKYDQVGASEIVYNYAVSSGTLSHVKISTSKGTGQKYYTKP